MRCQSDLEPGRCDHHFFTTSARLARKSLPISSDCWMDTIFSPMLRGVAGCPRSSCVAVELQSWHNIIAFAGCSHTQFSHFSSAASTDFAFLGVLSAGSWTIFAGLVMPAAQHCIVQCSPVLYSVLLYSNVTYICARVFGFVVLGCGARSLSSRHLSDRSPYAAATFLLSALNHVLASVHMIAEHRKPQMLLK